MNDFYYGREQSQAKHEILRRYLVPFANKILRTWPSLDFIDGFSGPWRNVDTDNLTDTSIGISLQTLSDVAEQMGFNERDRRIRCIFNESERVPYGLLKDFVERSKQDFPLLKIETFHGEFEENAPKIKIAANHAFQLLFVDPTGYTGFSPSSLAHFQGRSSEIIVNVMRSFIERFVSGDHEHRERFLKGLVGAKRAQYLLDTGLTIEAVEEEYLRMLRGTLGYEFAGYSPIHNPERNEIHFNLAYATNHPAGMEVMRNAEYKALSEHDRNRFKKSIKDSEPDLFGGMFDEIVIEGPYLRARKNHLETAKSELLRIIGENPAGLPFAKLTATAQQSLFLKNAELGNFVVELAEEGQIKPTWRDRGPKIRKPGSKDLIVAC